MKTVADLHEARLIQRVADLRKIALTVVLLTIAIIAAGILRIAHVRSVERDLAQTEAALPASWKPLDSFYNRSGHLLEQYADETSTPWSQAYIVLTTYLITLQTIKPTPKLEGNIDRFSAIGRVLHRYNSDVRAVAAAQRRGMSFRQLSKPELESLQRIVDHRFDKAQQATLDETLKLAKLVLFMSEKFRGDADKETQNPIHTILQLKSLEGREILLKIANGERWSEAETQLLLDDLYFDQGNTSAAKKIPLQQRIRDLPGGSISAVEARRDVLISRKRALAEESSVSLPLLGVQVTSNEVTLCTALVNAIFLVTLLLLFQSARTELSGLATNAPEQSKSARLLMVRDATVSTHGIFPRAVVVLMLTAPSLAALALFRIDLGPSALTLTAIVLLAAVGVLSLALLLQAQALVKAAAT